MRKYQCVQKHEECGGEYCQDCFEKQLKIDRLEEENKQLKARLRYREKKDKQPFGLSTPSSKITIKQGSLEENQKKKGGAKQGHKGHGRQTFNENEADGIVDLKVEDTSCPNCGGELYVKEIETRSIVDSVILEALNILYRCEVKRCKCCRTEVKRKPDVLPQYKYGNNLIAETVIQHYGQGIPLESIGKMWGKRVSTSALQNILHNLADKFTPAIEKLEAEYRKQPVKHADETGWRTDGKNGYAWLFCSETISLFKFNKTRGQVVAEETFGTENLPGTLVVDRYNGYNKVPCNIQYCFEHLKRDLIKLGERNPDSEEVHRFVRVLLPRIRRAISLQRRKIPDATYYTRSKVLKIKILECINESASHPGIQAYQDIFRSHPNRPIPLGG